MSRKKKIRIFAKAILQDLSDSKNDLQICKYACSLLGCNKVNTSLITILQDEKTAMDTDILEDNLNWYRPSSDDTETEINALIHHYTEKEFYFDFHMKKETFCKLIHEIKTDRCLIKMYNSELYQLSIERGLLISIWYLAKGALLSDICNKFDVIITIQSLIENIIKIFVQMQEAYILWPNKNESEASSHSYLTNYGYPDVIGALSSIHINFKPPAGREQLYLNKKIGHSLILQGISNTKNEFINIFAGFPGSMDCASVLKHSTLYKDIEETSPSNFFYNKYNLVANDSYPLRSWLMIPYRNEDSMSSKHIKHNASLKSALGTVENAFSLLLDRWRILSSVNASSVKLATDVIQASCVLHNFCLKADDAFDEMLRFFENGEKRNMEYVDMTKEGERKRHKNLISFG